MAATSFTWRYSARAVLLFRVSTLMLWTSKWICIPPAVRAIL